MYILHIYVYYIHIFILFEGLMAAGALTILVLIRYILCVVFTEWAIFTQALFCCAIITVFCL